MNIKPVADSIKNIFAKKGTINSILARTIPGPVRHSAKAVLPIGVAATVLMGLTGLMKNKENGRKNKIEKNAGKIAGLGFAIASSLKLYKTNVLETGKKGLFKNVKGLTAKAGVVLAGTVVVGFATKILAKVLSGIANNIENHNQAKNRRELATKIREQRAMQEIGIKRHKHTKAESKPQNIEQSEKPIQNIMPAPSLPATSLRASSLPAATFSTISISSYMSLIKANKDK